MNGAWDGFEASRLADATRAPSYVSTASQDSVLTELGELSQAGSGLIALYGAAGTGKSLVARVLGSRRRGRTLVFEATELTGGRVIDTLSDRVGGRDVSIRGEAQAKRKLSRLVRGFRGASTLIVVDHAERIGDATMLLELAELFGRASGLAAAASCLLIGCAEFMAWCPDTVARRFTARVLMPLWTEADAAAVLESRLNQMAAPPIVDPDALRLLHAASRGLGRRLLNLSDAVVAHAAAANYDRIDRTAMARALGQVDLAA